MFEALFGSEMPLAARFFIAFLVVLGLIGATAWAVRRFGAGRLSGDSVRGRQPRLAVIDAASVDTRRRLVLIRRDNVEHLLMIGGPTDVVVEPNIVRAAGARDNAREPVRVTLAGDTVGRTSAQTDSTWPLQPSTEPAQQPAQSSRSSRSSFSDDPWASNSEPSSRARASSSGLTGLAAELSARLHTPDHGASSGRSEPPRGNGANAFASGDQPRQQNDHNLADMAHQLEAALRRSPAPDGRPPVTDPLATPARPNEMPRASARDAKSRGEQRLDPAAGKNLYDNLEQEMASLLGRPSGKP